MLLWKYVHLKKQPCLLHISKARLECGVGCTLELMVLQLITKWPPCYISVRFLSANELGELATGVAAGGL